MERSVSRRFGLAARVVTVAVLSATTLCLAPPARAGLGGLVKSAKDKAAKATGQKETAPPAQAGGPVQFDDTTLELTGGLLDKLMACRKAADAEAKPQERKALNDRRDAITKEISDLSTRNGDAITANRDKRSNVGNCMEEALREIKEQKQKAMQQQILANPASGEKLARMSADMSQAQVKGDTATVARIQRQMEDMFSATHADSLEAGKKCGPMPALHPAAVRIEALRAELAQIEQKLRDMDEQQARLLTEKCGMTTRQIAMAWERIELYLARADGKSTPLGFSETEIKALSERKDALKAALKG